MFEVFDKLTKPGGVATFISTFSNPPDINDPQFSSTIEFRYNNENEEVYHHFSILLNDGTVEDATYRSTVDQALLKKLKKDEEVALKEFKEKLKQKSSDHALEIYINETFKKLNRIIDQCRSNKKLKERPFITEKLGELASKMSNTIPKELLPKIHPLHEVKETRGNPNFIKSGLSKEAFYQLADRANQLLESKPNLYKPKKSGAFIGEELTGKLMDEFDLKRGQIQNNFRKKCDKNGDLFEIKVGY